MEPPEILPPAPPPAVLSPRWALFILVGFVLGTALVQCAPARPAEMPSNASQQPRPLQRGDALTDTTQDAGPSPLSPVLPAQPLPWQKRPPCDPDAVEEEIQDACYGRMDRRPPCGPKLVEHRGKCYRAVEKRAAPVSGQ